MILTSERGPSFAKSQDRPSCGGSGSTKKSILRCSGRGIEARYARQQRCGDKESASQKHFLSVFSGRKCSDERKTTKDTKNIDRMKMHFDRRECRLFPAVSLRLPEITLPRASVPRFLHLFLCAIERLRLCGGENLFFRLRCTRGQSSRIREYGQKTSVRTAMTAGGQLRID